MAKQRVEARTRDAVEEVIRRARKKEDAPDLSTANLAGVDLSGLTCATPA